MLENIRKMSKRQKEIEKHKRISIIKTAFNMQLKKLSNAEKEYKNQQKKEYKLERAVYQSELLEMAADTMKTRDECIKIISDLFDN